MNNKGFTLIELLATIVILSLVMGLAATGVTNTIQNSKKRSEKLFVEKLGKSIDDYVSLKGSTLKEVGTRVTFQKCDTKQCKKPYTVEAFQVKKKDGGSITLRDLVDEHLVDIQKLINPKNKKGCLEEGKNPEIMVFKDREYVYYYYVNLSGSKTSCDILSENGLIDTLPTNLKNELKKKGIVS